LRQQKIDLGSLLVGLGALVLLAALFLDWYSPSLSAWDSFEFLDWALLAIAVAALVGVVQALRDGAAPRWLGAISVAALFIVASQLIDPPPAAREEGREIGAWIALGGAALMALATALSAAAVSVTVDVRARERRRRVPAVDRRDAPEPPPPPAPSPPPPPRTDPQRTQPIRPVEPRDPEPPGA
jgi:hypothetical protein